VVLHCASRVKNSQIYSRSKSNLITPARAFISRTWANQGIPHTCLLWVETLSRSQTRARHKTSRGTLIKKSQRSCPKFCFQTVIKSKLIRYKPNGSSAGFLFGNETTDLPSERLTLLGALNQVFVFGWPRVPYSAKHAGPVKKKFFPNSGRNLNFLPSL
jgi:hypothetical protein